MARVAKLFVTTANPPDCFILRGAVRALLAVEVQSALGLVEQPTPRGHADVVLRRLGDMPPLSVVLIELPVERRFRVSAHQPEMTNG